MKSRQFSSRWFRVYDEAVDDPKIQMLSDKLHRFLFNCWCLASKNDGYLPPISELAWRLRKTEAQVTAMLAELYERQLLEQEGDTFTPHNWACRQFHSDLSTTRVRRHREVQKTISTDHDPVEVENQTSLSEISTGVTCGESEWIEKHTGANKGDYKDLKRFHAVSETAPEQIQIQKRTDTHTETEKPVARAPKMPQASDLTEATSQRWEEFWARYPLKQRRDFAARQWISVVSVTAEAAVFACFDRYLESDAVARGVVQNPDKWLYEQHRNGWQGDWPRARESLTRQSTAESMLGKAEKLWKEAESRGEI